MPTKVPSTPPTTDVSTQQYHQQIFQCMRLLLSKRTWIDTNKTANQPDHQQIHQQSHNLNCQKRVWLPVAQLSQVMEQLLYWRLLLFLGQLLSNRSTITEIPVSSPTFEPPFCRTQPLTKVPRTDASTLPRGPTVMDYHYFVTHNILSFLLNPQVTLILQMIQLLRVHIHIMTILCHIDASFKLYSDHLPWQYPTHWKQMVQRTHFISA